MPIQIKFSSEDIKYKTIMSMGKASRLAMMPDYKIYLSDLAEGVALNEL